MSRCVLFDVLTAPGRILLGTGTFGTLQVVPEGQPPPPEVKRSWPSPLPGLLEMAIIGVDLSVVLPLCLLGTVIGRDSAFRELLIAAPAAMAVIVGANIAIFGGIMLHNAMMLRLARAMDVG